MAEIINLAAAREQKETTAQESLFALIEADFPGYNAPKLQALWDAFGLSVPCNLSEERQIELWVAVSGLGYAEATEGCLSEAARDALRKLPVPPLKKVTNGMF